MSTKRFSAGKQFYWQKVDYQIQRLLPENKLHIVNLKTNETRTVALAELVKALFVGELQFSDSHPANGEALRKYVDWADYPEESRAIAEYRWQVIEPILGLGPEQCRKAIEARVAQLKEAREDNQRSLNTALSTTSVYRWMRQYTRGGCDRRALIPNTDKRGGVQQSRLETEVDAIIQAVLETHCQGCEKSSIAFVQREVAVRIADENCVRVPSEYLQPPSRATLARRIRARAETLQAAPSRGKRAPRQELRQYGATDYPKMPLERVEIDHTRSDLIVVDDQDLLPLGRLTLTYCLDTATRYPLGYYLGFEPPSYLTVMECLHHTICPKSETQAQYGTEHTWQAYGIPYMLVIDNGKEFIGQDMEDACSLLGILLQRTPIKTPYFKAAVERMFGTLNTGLLHTLPGTTFSNILQRADYNSLKQACITLHELDTMMHLFLVDIYAESFHRGVEGIPARLWEQATVGGFSPRVPPSAEELHILLGRVARRTIQSYGIELHGLRYNCAELTPLRTRMSKCDNRRVKIKYNPSDLSHIQVYDPDEKHYLQVPALAQDYTQGLSLWKHKVIRNFVLSQQDTVDIVALGRAQRKIQAIVAEGLERKKLNTRSKVARWRGAAIQKETGVEASSAETGVTDAVLLNPALSLADLDMDAEQLEAAGWHVSYDLPQSGAGGA